MSDWRQRSAAPFDIDKRPATGSRGMVVSNHPLASAAGVEMLAAGGNAIDAAVATLFTLTVVEPMMVGMLGGGFANLRLADGRQLILEGQGSCPMAVGADTFQPDPDAAPGMLEAVGRRNSVGRAAMATPGNLLAWCEMLSRHGSLALADVMEPAIRHASRGFAATSYLADCVADCAADLARDPEIARVFMPGGVALAAGARVVNAAYADTLRLVAREGPGALYGGMPGVDAGGISAAGAGGSLGRLLAEDMQRHGGYLTQQDLQRYRTHDMDVLRANYRGFEITGPPPPCAGPLHIGQMLKILEGFDLGRSGFGSADTLHLMAEVLKIAFADRASATGDPDFVAVPVARLLSSEAAMQRRAAIDMNRAQDWQAAVTPGDPSHPIPPQPYESANTTHVTVADRDGRIVCATQTINSLFGARYMVPDTGMIPNNYLYTFNPQPGLANSLAPGKRVTSSMAPLIVLKDGQPRFALGLPGGLRIFPSAMQAVINLIDHGMSLQEAVEAPRIWTQGFGLELEPQVPEAVAEQLRARGHEVLRVPNVGGGLCAIRFHDNGDMEGAACWRADGTPMGVGGGLARSGVRFLPEAQRR
jgi:gamma-glutamyltranspeptidase/glutathione hydrolase